mgnify:CR=1 FL=1
MKNNLLTLLSVLMLASCGGDKKNSTENVIENGDLSALREKRTELVTASETLLKEIEQIDNAISAKDDSHKMALVSTMTAKDTLFNHYIEVQAAVQTKQNILLNAQYGGTLTRVLVKEGQAVRKGQTLANIDDGGLGQQLAQMQVQVSLAKTTFERQQNLWSQKIGSEMQYLQAKANYEGQLKSVSQMKSQLAKTRIIAPFSGTIDQIVTDQGSAVGPGTPVMRIVSLANMYLEASVPEKNIKTVKKGTEVMVELPVIGEALTTKISSASNYINPANRTFDIQVNVPNKSGNIKPNLTAKLKIKDYTNPNVITVPLSIISENAEGEQYLYVASDVKNNEATAKKVIISTGLTYGTAIEVLTGINAGDQIIKEGARSVKDGQKVSIIK